MRKLLWVSALLAACAGSRPPPPSLPRLDGPVPMRSTPDARFRDGAPLAKDAKPFVPPTVQERKLANGIRVLFVERHDVPMVTLRVVSDRGADQADPGIAEFWERAALRATEKHPSYEILEAWNDLGAYYRPHITHDSTQLEVRVLAKLLVPATKLLGELTTHAAFPVSQVELIRQRMRAALSVSWDDAEGQLELAMHSELYPGKHPYRDPFAPPESINKVDGAILAGYHKYAFAPGHVTIVAVGDTTLDEVTAALEPAFADLSGPKVGAQAPPKPPAEPSAEPRFVVIARPGTQALVGAAWLGPSRDIEDRAALWIAEQELGAVLGHKLRVELGITYGVAIVAQHGRGRLPLFVRTAVETPAVGEAAREIVNAVERLNKELLKADYLAEDKAAIANAAGLFDSTHSTAASIAHLAVYALPLDYYAQRAVMVNKVSVEEVRTAFSRYLPTDRLKFYIVGDPALVKPQLEKLKLGDVAVRTPFTLGP